MTSVIKPKMIKKSFTSATVTSSTYYYNGTIDVSLSGHTPIAIAGYQCNQAADFFYKMILVGNTLEFGMARRDNAAISGATLTVDILYI